MKVQTLSDISALIPHTGVEMKSPILFGADEGERGPRDDLDSGISQWDVALSSVILWNF